MSVYPVFEQFQSWQGEGVHTGRAAYFIRLYGCPLRCSWCDSAGTWGGGGEPAACVENFSPEILAKNARSAHPDFVVITGGEPAIHDLAPLCDALHANALRVHLETSGAFPIRGNVDWVSLSPKAQRLPLAENVARASEIKWIIESPETLEFWLEKMPAKSVPAGVPVWLHPEWSHRADAAVLSAISACVCSLGFPFRAGWQLHKLYSVR